ncbi:MAG: phenylalanine--tRNA ligase subunit alpha [Saprospiraceae bacterium]|jgi:phenylalanyl-tRNA synthetase alpha chain
MSLNPFEQLQHIQKEIEAFNIADQNLLEEFRIRFLGSKNVLKPISASIREIPNERKKEFGQLVNAIKNAAEQKYASHQNSLKEHSTAKGQEDMDLTAPGFPLNMGARHPLAITLNKIIKIFEGIGFSVAEDREIEDDWHNFTAMNTPEDHPARDMQDTYYLKNSSQYLLRTHTSSVQARVMEQHQPPIRIIAPGRVYRNETISARSHAQFHQVEGLYIDEKVSFADLKQTLLYFAKEMYGAKTQIRLRPSFFPFTEPSAEMDVSCFICNAEGCNICKYSGWVEVLGCGMVDPAVLENCGIDSQKYNGYAFGMGIERQAMMLHGITDIRLFFENDIRFLSQFVSA